jgi:hypothetical protein
MSAGPDARVSSGPGTTRWRRRVPLLVGEQTLDLLSARCGTRKARARVTVDERLAEGALLRTTRAAQRLCRNGAFLCPQAGRTRTVTDDLRAPASGRQASQASRSARPERSKFAAAFALLGVAALLAIVGAGLVVTRSKRGTQTAGSEIPSFPAGPGWIPLGDSSGLQLRVRPPPGWRLVSFRLKYLSLASKRDCYTAWLTTWVEPGKPGVAPERSKVVLGYVLGRDYAVGPQSSGGHSLPFSGVPGGAIRSFVVFQPQRSTGVMVAPLPNARGNAVIVLRGLPDPHRHCSAVEQAHAVHNLSLTLEHLRVRSVAGAARSVTDLVRIRQ